MFHADHTSLTPSAFPLTLSHSSSWHCVAQRVARGQPSPTAQPTYQALQVGFQFSVFDLG